MFKLTIVFPFDSIESSWTLLISRLSRLLFLLESNNYSLAYVLYSIEMHRFSNNKKPIESLEKALLVYREGGSQRTLRNLRGKAHFLYKILLGALIAAHNF